MAVLDDFQRANEDPLSKGGSWGPLSANQQLRLVSLHAEGRPSVSTGSAWIAQTFGPDCELETGVRAPVISTFNSMLIGVRLKDLGSGNWDGYIIQYRNGPGPSEWTADIQVVTNGANTTISPTITIGGNVDALRLRAQGSTLTASSHDPTLGWSTFATVTDTTWAAAGNVGIGGFGDGWYFPYVSAATLTPAVTASFDFVTVF